MRPVISVCIVTRRRAAQLDACLVSLQDQAAPPPYELLVCSDGDGEVAAQVHGRFPEATVIEVSRAFPGVSRNLLTQRASGDWLLFLDDDVTLDPALLRRLAELARQHPHVGVLGGPNLTPPCSSDFQRLQGEVLASAVASGPVRRRYARSPAVPAHERDLILCNLAVRRSEMLPFADDLRAGEESGVLTEMARRGVQMLYEPDLIVYHERRPTLAGFARQMLRYGDGRGLVLLRRPRAFGAYHLVPVALLVYLAVLPALVLGSPLWWIPIAVYALVVLAAALQACLALRHLRSLPQAVALILCVHLLYGAGVVKGMLSRRRAGAAVRAHQVAPPEPPAG